MKKAARNYTSNSNIWSGKMTRIPTIGSGNGGTLVILLDRIMGFLMYRKSVKATKTNLGVAMTTATFAQQAPEPDAGGHQ